MKTNKKINSELTNGELRNIFNGFVSDEEMEKTISDSKKAFSMLNRSKEFKK
jgi:hypothetical protein